MNAWMVPEMFWGLFSAHRPDARKFPFALLGKSGLRQAALAFPFQFLLLHPLA